MKVPSEAVQQLLKAVTDCCDQEDVSIRERQVRNWRKLKLLWEGFSQVWYSEVAHDWRVWDALEDDENSDQSYYDKPVNVFRAYLESIIAALSVSIPPIKCYPDDADNPLDLATAKAGDKIGQLVYRHNDVPLLWLHALFIFVTEGMMACYSYPKKDESYGTYKVDQYSETEEEHQITSCPNCGFQFDEKTVEEAKKLENQIKSEYAPGPDEVAINDIVNEGIDLCPACMALVDPEITQHKVIVTRLTGQSTEVKSRICLEVYGGLNVKIPNYARTQKDCPYLKFSEESNYTIVAQKYEHLKGKPAKELRKKITSGENNAGSFDQYDQWARLSPQYMGEYPINVVTVNKYWLRPCAFNFLQDGADRDRLNKLYPNGVHVTYINDTFAEACNESLDDRWTISYNAMSDFVHFDPLGTLLVSIQEITNDLLSLTIQTIEHGIGQTFADPAVLDFNAYQQTEVTPGGIFPTKPLSGKRIGDAFYEVKTATLSAEVMPFGQQVQSLAQLASGALPSLFGGAVQGAGETASEYSMSRAQALQRLQNNWKMLTGWWKQIFSKVVPMFIKEMQDDEKDVQQTDDGNFVNVFIRKAEVEGKIGKVELEANENIPMSWSQQRDVLMNLMQASNPQVLEILNAPENRAIIHDYLGLTDLYVPGEDDIIKQYDEIKLLLTSQPIPSGDPQMPLLPSVEINAEYDNHQVEFEICRKWIISEAGRQTKTENQAGYDNVILHGKLHLMQLQMQQQQQQMAEQEQKGAAPGKKPNKPKTKQAPITEERDVQTIQ